MKDKINMAEFKGKEITKEQLAEWLKRDLETVFYLMAEIARSEIIRDAITAVLYEAQQAEIKKREILNSIDKDPE